MKALFFYGVTMAFTCQKCGKPSTDKAVIIHSNFKAS